MNPRETAGGAEKWQPIETAPKDGSRIRVRGRNWGRRDGWHRADAEWHWAGWNGPGFYAAHDDSHLKYLTDWKPIQIAALRATREQGEG